VTSQHADARPPRPWPLLVLAAPAFVAIWSGWVGLGEMTGFGDVKPLPGTPLAGLTVHTAITLPIGVETYAAYALGVWLAEVGNARALAFARASAIGSLLLGAGGQVAYHLLKAAGVQRAPWPITTIVSVLPVATLGMGVALAHMLKRPKVDASASGLPVPDHAPAFRLAAGLRLEVERPGHDAPAPFPEAPPGRAPVDVVATVVAPAGAPEAPRGIAAPLDAPPAPPRVAPAPPRPGAIEPPRGDREALYLAWTRDPEAWTPARVEEHLDLSSTKAARSLVDRWRVRQERERTERGRQAGGVTAR
jgi:hypothetical protein